MIKRNAKALWTGSIQKGEGRMNVGSGSINVAYSFGTRFGSDEGTNPEELIGAAHAGCFSMALSKLLGDNGFEPQSIETTADVSMNPDALAIEKVHLTLSANIPGISEENFKEIALAAKENCPVSKALAGVDITLDSALKAE